MKNEVLWRKQPQFLLGVIVGIIAGFISQMICPGDGFWHYFVRFMVVLAVILISILWIIPAVVKKKHGRNITENSSK